MIIRFHTKWAHEDAASLHQSLYQDGSTALLITDPLTGEVITTATVCLMDYHEKPVDNHVFIKDYSENEGTLQALQDAGVIGAPVREVSFGPYDAKAYECPLTTDIDKL